MEQGKQRRSFSPALKTRAVERMRAGESPTELALELGVRRKVLYEWKEAVETGRGFPGKGHPCKPAAQSAAARTAIAPDGAERIQELEALVGRLTLNGANGMGQMMQMANGKWDVLACHFSQAIENTTFTMNMTSSAGKTAFWPVWLCGHHEKWQMGRPGLSLLSSY